MKDVESRKHFDYMLILAKFRESGRTYLTLSNYLIQDFVLNFTMELIFKIYIEVIALNQEVCCHMALKD